MLRHDNNGGDPPPPNPTPPSVYVIVYIYKRINLSLATRGHAPIYVYSFKYGLKLVSAFFVVVAELDLMGIIWNY